VEKEYIRLLLPPLGAGALGSLDEIWADLPSQEDMKIWLVANGIWDEKLSGTKI
jgi:hypothetical protein